MKSNIIKIFFIFIFIFILYNFQTPQDVDGAPSRVVEYKITAEVLNKTIDSDRTYCDIEIISGVTEDGKPDDRVEEGKIIHASKFTGIDCVEGDIIEARLTWQRDEFGEWYQLYEVELYDLDEDVDKKSYLLFAIFVGVVVFVLIIIFFIIKNKKK